MANSKHQNHITRRTLLKLLAAGGIGLGASAMLPGEWVKPAMKVGVLPVHAQSSPAPTVEPSSTPTETPTIEPSSTPTETPTVEPTATEEPIFPTPELPFIEPGA